MNQRYTVHQVINALQRGKGYISSAASELGCTCGTVHRYIRRHPMIAQALDDIRSKRHDFVESKLQQLIEEGNVAATIFYLKTQCKDRGYIERLEHRGETVIRLKVVYPEQTEPEPTKLEPRESEYWNERD